MHLYSDHRGACTEKKMSGVKIHALGFKAWHFHLLRTESHRTRATDFFSAPPSLPIGRCSHCSVHKLRTTYLIKHPCNFIVVAFSPRPNIHALVSLMGLETVGGTNHQQRSSWMCCVPCCFAVVVRVAREIILHAFELLVGSEDHYLMGFQLLNTISTRFWRSSLYSKTFITHGS